MEQMMRHAIRFAGLMLGDGWTIASASERPNILWITAEDIGPQLGCYGDAYAQTPRLDALAKEGVVFRRCFSNAPVCAPARSTLITGRYAPTLGSQNMRTDVPFDGRFFTEWLRDAGY